MGNVYHSRQLREPHLSVLEQGLGQAREGRWKKSLYCACGEVALFPLQHDVTQGLVI
jgi:hypothetical protein